MSTLDNFLKKVNLPAISISLLAIAGTLAGLQPLNAGETSPLQEDSPKIRIISDSQAQKPTTEDKSNQVVEANNSADIPEKIVVKRFDVVGSSIFSPEELNQAVKSYRNRPLTLPELFQARSTITKLYTDKGYVSSGAYIPPQELDDGTVKIAILEGKLEEVNVSGTKKLSPNYVSSRIEAAAGKPINVDNLLSALQLLRLDPFN